MPSNRVYESGIIVPWMLVTANLMRGNHIVRWGREERFKRLYRVSGAALLMRWAKER